MFNLFTKEKESENDDNHLSLISIAALLIHSAKIDQNFTEKEKNIIRTISTKPPNCFTVSGKSLILFK